MICTLYLCAKVTVVAINPINASSHGTQKKSNLIGHMAFPQMPWEI